MGERFALVTGATGFVGRNLCPYLVNTGFKVRATFTQKRASLEDTGEAIEWMRVEPVGPHADWGKALAGGITHVVHLAALAHRVAPGDSVADAKYDEVNHLGTATLARAVLKTPSVQRFLFASSIGAVTSQSVAPVTEATPCHPDTPYGMSKLAAEEAIQSLFRGEATEWCILRPPLLYGPMNPGNMERLMKLLKLKVPLPFGSVKNRRSFMFVGNFVDAISVGLIHPAAAGRIFCVADGHPLSTRELIDGLGRASGERVRVFPFPTIALRMLGGFGSLINTVTGSSVGFDLPSINKLCASLVVDDAHFRKVCGWRPPFTTDQGLRTTIGLEAVEQL